VQETLFPAGVQDVPEKSFLPSASGGDEKKRGSSRKKAENSFSATSLTG